MAFLKLNGTSLWTRLNSSLISLCAVCFFLLWPITQVNIYSNLGFIHYIKAQHMVVDVGKHIRMAEDRFQTSIRYLGTLPKSNRGLGFLYFYYGEFEKSLNVWRVADYNAKELIAFGDRSADLGEPSEAEKWYKIAVDIDHKQSDTLARFYFWQRNYDSAIEIWSDALLINEDSPNRLLWWRGLTNSYHATMQWNLAIQSVGDALAEFPNDPQLLTNKGVILYKIELAPSEALTFIEQAISIDENFASAYGAMADIYFSEKDYEQALSYYGKAVSLDDNIKWWHVAQANSARFLGEQELALNLYLQTVELFPSYAPAYFEMAWGYHQLGNLYMAVESIEQALEHSSSPSANYYIRAGQIYLDANLREKALAAYLRAYELSPTDARIEVGLQQLQEQQ